MATKTFLLRLSPDLHAELLADAQREHRSLHAEIVHRLVSYVPTAAVGLRAQEVAEAAEVELVAGEQAEQQEGGVLGPTDASLRKANQGPWSGRPSPAAASPPAASSRKLRTVMCPHRVAAGSFCKRCD